MSDRVVAPRRRQLILDELRRTGSVRVSSLTRTLGVSDMTVRRDLDALGEAGLLVKVHGGATTPDDRSRHAEEPAFREKSGRQIAEKRGIAEAAAALVRSGTAIGVGAGTTTWYFAQAIAQAIAEVRDLLVVTNSVHVADVLYDQDRPDRTVILTGGQRTPSDALVGPLAAHALEGLHLDQVFIGVHGMSQRAGFSTPNLLEADINRAFVRAADRLVVLADHTKWRTVGLSTFARLDEAHLLVSDAGLDEATRDRLAGTVGELVIAGPSPVAA